MSTTIGPRARETGGAHCAARRPYAGGRRASAIIEDGALLAALGLSVVVARHPRPLPGDVRGAVTLQSIMRPHKTLSVVLAQPSIWTWPRPATFMLIGAVSRLVLLRRWLDALLIAAVPPIASGTTYLTTLLVRRPRPSGHGLYIHRTIKTYYSFPSGHVEHAVTFFGLLLFLTYQARRPGWWIWPVRFVLGGLIILMGPSRLLEGEHWPSDVVAGYLYGTFWLLLGMHLYRGQALRLPRMLVPDDATPTQPADRRRCAARMSPRRRWALTAPTMQDGRSSRARSQAAQAVS